MNAVIPTVAPTPEEIAEALAILQMTLDDVRCAYCGDKATEWDHLRPLVRDRRPTGFISEIANLVPACGKCNQSKGNKPWREWLFSTARLSPTGRRITELDKRAAALDLYECWKQPTRVDFVGILGNENWEAYWALCEKVNQELRVSHEVAVSLRARVLKALLEGEAEV